MSTSVDNDVENSLAVWTNRSRSVDIDAIPIHSSAWPVAVSERIGSLTSVSSTPVEVRRSARRRRTVSAYRDGARIVVLIPARFTAEQERDWVAKMVARVDGTTTKRRAPSGDTALLNRARRLSDEYLDGMARPVTVRWVPTMRTRWASCTPADRTIRLSRRLQDMPLWVQDYVLVHELAHLLEAGHGPRFWRLVERYPRTERARGYLDGISAAADLPIADDLAEDLEPLPDLGGTAG